MNEQEKQEQQADEVAWEKLPPGVRLVRTLQGHTAWIGRIAWSPDGRTLASPSADKTIRLWNADTGECIRVLHGHKGDVNIVVFDPIGHKMASGSIDGVVHIWDPISGKRQQTHSLQNWVDGVAFDATGNTLAIASGDGMVRILDIPAGQFKSILSSQQRIGNVISFDPSGFTLASVAEDNTVNLCDVGSFRVHRSCAGHQDSVHAVSFGCSGIRIATASVDRTVKVWNVKTGYLELSLEGHTNAVNCVHWSADCRLIASKAKDHTVRIWRSDDGSCAAIIKEPTLSQYYWPPGLAFHPRMPLLATVGSASRTRGEDFDCVIHIWELDLDVLLGQVAEPTAHYVNAKVVLVGDHSVGKSALGYRLIHGAFKEQAATHGQQFWVFPALGKRRADGTDCEAILWDFAGQPDYRLVHALFVDNADLALVLFDASDLRDPLHGVDFWLKQLPLQRGQSRSPIILVAAQSDRGTCSLAPEELSAFCRRHGIVGPITTSAYTGLGIAELVERMKSLIPWEDKPATVTTTTFKRIKDYVLGLKEAEADGQTIVTPEELRGRLEAADADWRFTDAEMLTAVGHLENYGYVKRLRTSKGEQRVLLQPERLNNLASSFVLEARRNPKGVGALEEKRLLAGDYTFPELKDLHESERDVLLDSAALLFLEHNVCFRETDPLRMEPYLVFPELINLKKPPEEEQATEDGVAYTVSGPTENVFASLVVLLGYTHTFTRTAQWQNNARYEVGDGLMCGFRQEAERDGELDFVLCFRPQVGPPVRTLFQGLFESFLGRRNLTVMRYEPVRCSNAECGRLLDRSVVRQRMKEGKTFAFCNECGEKLTLPKMAEPIQLAREIQAEVELQRRSADQRTIFEQALFRVQAYVTEQKIKSLECFISYSWGVPEHERWVEKHLATDLQKAGIDVVLDRWHNTQIGASVARFIERIEKSDRIVMVGTPLYRRKYDNKDTTTGYVVAAEVDVIGNRLLGTETQKASVLPLLLDGEKTSSLPPLLHGRVYADFRDESAYFTTAFDLILSLYQLPPNHPAVANLRESLRGPEMR